MRPEKQSADVSHITQSLSVVILITRSKTDYVNDDNIVVIKSRLVKIGTAMRGEWTRGVSLEDCLAFHEMIILIITSQKYRHYGRTPWTKTRGFLLNKATGGSIHHRGSQCSVEHSGIKTLRSSELYGLM